MRFRRIAKRSLEYASIVSLMRAGALLPYKLGFHVFMFIGAIASRIFRSDMKRAVQNLGIAFPDTPMVFRRSMSRAMFKALAQNAFEFLKLNHASQERILSRVDSLEGLEYFEEAYKKGRGLISVTGHIGCWELMAVYMSVRGYPVSVVARKLWMDRLNHKLVGIRESHGVRSIDRDANPRVIMERLKRKEIVGVLIDQSTRVSGIYVPFFKRPAYTPSGIARIAFLTGALIVPMAIYLKRNFKHEIKMLKPIDPLSIEGARDERVNALTSMCSKAIETLIRIDPKQWVWFHDRWRIREERELQYVATC